MIRVVPFNLGVNFFFIGRSDLRPHDRKQKIHPKRAVSDQTAKLFDTCVKFVKVREVVAHDSETACIRHGCHELYRGRRCGLGLSASGHSCQHDWIFDPQHVAQWGVKSVYHIVCLRTR